MNDSLEQGAETINSTVQESVNSISSWLNDLGSKALAYVVRIGIAILIFFVVWKILKKFCAWLSKQMEKRHVDPSVRSFVVSFLKYGVMFFVIVEIIVQLDIVTASSIAALLGSAGIGISLAAQGALSNFAGGILLLTLRPFRAGDYIVVPALSAEGTVDKIEMYYTTLRTAYNEIVKIPNSQLTNGQVTNLTALGERKLEIKVGISYDADLQKAKDTLAELMEADDRIGKEGRQIYVDELADSAVVLGLRCLLKADDYWPVRWSLNEKIKQAFDQAGIEIPYGQLDVHLKQEKPAGIQEE